MAKDLLRVELEVTANVKKAREQFKKLQEDLTNLGETAPAVTEGFGKGLPKQIAEARNSIAILKTSLNSAFNVDTGKLDFTKFNQQLKISGQSLNTIKDNLLSMGPAGAQALGQLQTAVLNADTRVVRLGKKVEELKTTLANTFRWQISSSVLHAALGAIQTAYGYAQDLNESLNNIRIVTGYSADEMAIFAERANDAAQALSATTTQYTDAALIYYQQGIRDQEEIQKRVDTTIKLANVTHSSAEEVSSQMTAIWNNFADGADNLEYYADAITALGAATASSSAEIAQGLEKFAAVSETVGLSYEYATAALATVVATTRQSADIVGTSFKTLFARLEGLQLGKTLDDGTDLNKYSKALATVGVNVKDASGQLKDMDTILDELGARWKTLGEDQQVALAQTVGGVRQYTQLIALMNNYDTFKQNVDIASGSEGTLQKQQEIYAESWEAANKRVKAAWEDIYKDLIDDKAFIQITNDLANILKSLEKIIDRMGGLKGVIFTLMPLFTKLFDKQIAQNFQNAFLNIQNMIPSFRQKAEKERQDFLRSSAKSMELRGDLAGKIEYEFLEKTLGIEDKLSNERKEQLNTLKEFAKLETKVLQDKEKELKLAEEEEKVAYAQNRSITPVSEDITKRLGRLKAGENILTSDYIDPYSIDSISGTMTKYNAIVDTSLLNTRRDYGGAGNPHAANSLTNLNNYLDEHAALVLKAKEDPDTYAEQIYEIEEKIKEEFKKFTNSIIGAQDDTLDVVERSAIDVSVDEEAKNVEKEIADLKQRRDDLNGANNQEIRQAVKDWNTLAHHPDIKPSKEDYDVPRETLRKYGLMETGKGPSYAENLINEIDTAGGVEKALDEYNIKIETLEQTLDRLKQKNPEIISAIRADVLATEESSKAKAELAFQTEVASKAQEELNRKTEETLDNPYDNGQILSAYTTTFTSLISMTTSLNSAFSSLFDESLSGEEKFEAAIQGLISTLPILTMLFQKQNLEMLASGAIKLKDAAASTKAAIANTIQALSEKGLSAAVKETTQKLKEKVAVSSAATQSIGLLTLAIAAAVIVWQTYKNGIEELDEIIGNNKSRREELENQKKETQEILSQINALDKLQSQVEEGIASKEDYNKQILQVAESLGIENASVYAQAEAYGYLAEKIKQTKEEKEQELIDQGLQAGGTYRSSAAAAEAQITATKKLIGGIVGAILPGGGPGASQTIMKNIDEDFDWSGATDIEALQQAKQMQQHLNENPDSIDPHALSIKQFSEAVGGLDNFIAGLEESINETSQAFGRTKGNSILESSQNLSDIYNKLENFKSAIQESGSKFFDPKEARAGAIAAIEEQGGVLGSSFGILNELSKTTGINLQTLISGLDKLNLTDKDLINTSNFLIQKTELFAALYHNSGEDIAKTLELISYELEASDLSSLALSLTEFAEAVNKLKIGDILKEEDFGKLQTNFEKLGLEILNFGQKAADGSFVITSSIEEMKNAMADATVDKITNFYNKVNNGDLEGVQSQIDEMLKGMNLQALQTATNIQEKGLDLDSILRDARMASVQNIDKVYGDDLEFSSRQQSETAAMDEARGKISEFTGLDLEDIDEKTLNYFYGFEETIDGFTRLAPKIENFHKYINDLETGEVPEDFSIILEYQKLLDALTSGEGYEDIDFTALLDSSLLELDTLEEIYNRLPQEIQENIDITKGYTKAIQAQAESLDMDNEALSEQADYLEENNKYLIDNEEASLNVAFANQRLVKGIEELNSGIEDWTEILINSVEGTEEYTDAIESINEKLKNVFNTNQDIDSSFIVNNLELIKQAATGDLEAIQDLSNEYARFALENSGNMTAIVDEMNLSADAIFSQIDAIDNNLEFGATLDTQPFLLEMANMMAAAGTDVDAINSFFQTLGWVGQLKYQYDEDTGRNILVGMETMHYSRAPVQSASKKSSSGKGSSRSKKDKKDYEDEYERYYTINRQIQDQIDEVERLSKVKDRAWGKAKLDLLDKESDALQTQIDLQNEKIRQVEQYYKYDQERLNFFGAQYDENGVVTNYDEMVKREVAAYNAAVDRYNNGGGEGAFSLAEDRYNKFKEILKQYDETNQLWQEEMDKLTDLKNEYYDMQLEKIQTKVEMDIEVDDSDLKVLEYELDRIRKKAFSTAEAIAKIGEQLDVNLDKQKVYNDALEDILANHGISDIGEINNLDESTIANLGFTQDEIKALEEYNENLLETQKELNQLEEDILNGPVEAFKEWNDEFDYQEDKIENNINLLKQYKNIADLIYSNSKGVTDQFLYGIMNNTYNNMVTGVGSAYTEWQANKAALAEAMAAYEESIAAGADEQTITLLRNNLREMEEMVDKSRDDMLKKTEEALKQAEDLLKQFVENAAKAVQEAFSATDWDMTKFDRLKTLDDEYLDDYEKIYELSKLTRDVNNSMDSMDTVRAKERLKEITQEIAEIEESNKEISQYEVDALRKKYELRLAEIALEDAQAAKNTVRMSRDNDGNWSYVYTADDSKVDKARQNYEDKLYEYQKLNSDFIKNQQENFLKLEQEYTDAMQKIAEDSSLNEEDKLTRLQETQAYYQRMAEIMTDQLGIALDRNSELYHKDWLDYSKMTDYKISKLEDYQTQIEFTYTGYLQPNIESAMDLLTQFTNATVGEGGYFPQIVQGLEEFKDRQDEVLHAAGTTLEDYATYVEDAMYAAGENSVKASDEVSLAALTMREAFDQVIAKINELNQKNLSSVRSDIENTVKIINKLIGAYKDVSNAAYEAQRAAQAAAAAQVNFSSSSTSKSNSGSGSNSLLNSSKNSLSGTALSNAAHFLYLLSSDRQTSSGSSIWQNVTSSGKYFSSTNAKTSEDSFKLLLRTLADNDIDALRKNADKYAKTRYNTYKFDTGGYTGSWGAGGRLAMLHQKELVLNAHDTENMLNTIQMVRDIVASIDTRAAAAGAMNINAGYAGNASAGAQDLNQNVHIEANFPNATDHNEIELALTNLVNRASQYAGRKKP